MTVLYRLGTVVVLEFVLVGCGGVFVRDWLWVKSTYSTVFKIL